MARRHEFAARRRAAGLSQEQLASHLGVERSTVARWEAGVTEPRPWLRPLLADALQLPLGDVDALLVAAPAAEAIPHRGASVDVGVDEGDSTDLLELLSTWQFDSAGVAALHDETMRLACLYLSQPSSVIEPRLRGARQTAFGWLRGRGDRGPSSDLLVVAGWLCGFSAHLCVDAGDYVGAAVHVRTARVCGESAGSPDLQAWAWSLSSLIAYWTGRYAEAKSAAQQGLAHSPSALSVCRLASLEARAAAAQSDLRTVHAALRRAGSAREAAEGQPRRPGLLDFPDAKYFAYAGTSMVSLGSEHAGNSATLSAAALASYAAMPVEEVSRGDVLAAHCDLSKAALLLGDPTGAGRHLEEVVGAAAQGLSASIVTRLRDVHQLAPTMRLPEPGVVQVQTLVRDAVGQAASAGRPNRAP